jgi:hypothetical protein
VGANWSTGEPTGRYVQIMRFRDRKHQQQVQAAERADPAAQTLINEFCQLINFSYQQQQGLFATGFYSSVMPVGPGGRTVAATATTSAGAAPATAEAAAEPAPAAGESAETYVPPPPRPQPETSKPANGQHSSAPTPAVDESEGELDLGTLEEDIPPARGDLQDQDYRNVSLLNLGSDADDMAPLDLDAEPERPRSNRNGMS